MPRLSLALSVVVLAAVAALAPPLLSACTQQTEGQRCDATGSGDSDCETGLVCISKEELLDGLVDRCCPPSNGVDSCTRRTGTGTGGSAGSGGGAGTGGSAGASASYTCVENTSKILCSCPDGTSPLLQVCSLSSSTGTAGASGSTTTSFSQCPCRSATTGAGGSAGASGASGTSGQGGTAAGASGATAAGAGGSDGG